MVLAQEPPAEHADVPKARAVAGVADGADDVDELLVEEISIDGMCGVY